MGRTHVLLAVMALGALPGCGSAACAAGMCAAPAASSSASSSPSHSPSATAAGGTTVSATDHGWTTTAVLEPVPGPLKVTVTVPGPIQVEGGCVPALVAWLVGPEGRRIDPSPSPGARCQAIQVEDVPAGQSMDFTVILARPPAATYSIHGLLRTHLPVGYGARVSENLPIVTMNIP